VRALRWSTLQVPDFSDPAMMAAIAEAPTDQEELRRNERLRELATKMRNETNTARAETSGEPRATPVCSCG
jgi:hypothetical protein